MAESNDNDSHFSVKDSNSRSGADNVGDDDGAMPNASGYYQDEALVGDENPSNALESKKEGNPFSFKRFLNQDAVNHRLQNFRRTNYSPDNIASCNSGPAINQNFSYIGMDNGTKVLNTNDMASVLPDFVQDHLVIEQCYLNSSPSTINIDSLNLHNLPDLNVEHRHVNNDGQRNGINHHSTNTGVSNLPDCTPDVRDYCGRSDLDGFSSNKTLPDFTVNTSGVSRTIDRENDGFFSMDARDSSTKRKNVQRNSENNQSNRCNPRMSSSPSVPLDLPSYDGAEAVSVSSISLEQPIPFDLTVAAEDRNGSYRGMPSTETVSKSLPDFLSDGPIQNDRLGENLQLGNLVSSIHDNDQRTSNAENDRFDRSRIERELILLRRELAEKNRRIHLLESEIQEIHNQDRRESVSSDHAHLQTDRTLRQTLERASKAETALMKSMLENNRLKLKLSSLRVENSAVEPDDELGDSRGLHKSQKVAKELRMTADAAENSLRSLLTGIDNLRTIAATIESMQVYNEKTDDMDDFNNEDSASGPAL